MAARTTLVRCIALAGLLALAAAACRRAEPTWIEGPHYGVTVSPQALTLPLGGADSLTALLTGGVSGDERIADWSVSQPDVVEVVRVLPRGVLLVGRKPGTVSVIATWRMMPTAKGAALVTVRACGTGSLPACWDSISAKSATARRR